MKGVFHVRGQASGPALRLPTPLSFWGGVEAETGRIIDHSQPHFGAELKGRVLVMPSGRGSSSASSVLAETIRNGTGPVAIVMERPDPIVTAGAMVAQSLVNFIQIPDKSRTRGWVAKGAQGEILGSIFITEESEEEAKLRLFYVEPSARGQGIGSTLVREAIAFSREKGFNRITLYTVSILHSALRIYSAAGFTLQSEAPTNEYGPELMTQIWALDLGQAVESDAKATAFNNC